MSSIESAIDTLVSEIKKTLSSIQDVNKTSAMELFDILDTRIKTLEEPRFSYLENRYNEIGRKVIPHMTGEQIGFCISEKTDKTDLLVRFSDEELMTELFSRDANIGANLSKSQAEELLSELLKSQVSDEMEEDLVTYVISNVDTNILLEQFNEDCLLETTIERCSASIILTAVARSL